MATANIVEQGIDRFQSAVDDVQNELQRLQKELRARRRKIEKEAEKRVKQLREDIRDNELVKRADAIRKDLRRQVEQGVDGVLSAFQIASKSDVRKIDKKLSAISKRIRELEGHTSEAEETASV
jgi:hypothetical protein